MKRIARWCEKCREWLRSLPAEEARVVKELAAYTNARPMDHCDCDRCEAERVS